MIEQDLKQLGRGIAALRLARQLTQAELAYEAGVSERTLQRVEAGEVVKTDGLLKVVRELGRIDELLAAADTAAFSPRELARGRQPAHPDENNHGEPPRRRVRHPASKPGRDKGSGRSPQQLIWPEDTE